MATKTNVYLNFNDTTEEVFNFYQSVFGGEFTMVMRFSDMPAEYADPKENGKKIMHISLPIGEGTVLMGSDTPSSFPPVTVGNNFSISVNTDTEKEADRIYAALSAGGKVTMPMDKAFWGSYFGMLVDKFGINWMISCEPAK